MVVHMVCRSGTFLCTLTALIRGRYHISGQARDFPSQPSAPSPLHPSQTPPFAFIQSLSLSLLFLSFGHLSQDSALRLLLCSCRLLDDSLGLVQPVSHQPKLLSAHPCSNP
jgi:hypothetical protein